MVIFVIAPIIGALIASALGGVWSSAQTIFQNQYNSPKSQLKRLRKAGLPLAYMYQGRVNQQSETPKLSIDPDLGTVEQKQLGLQERLNDEQIKKLVEEVNSLIIENEMSGAERDYWINRGSIDKHGSEDPELWTTITNLDKKLDWEQTVREMDAFLKKNSVTLSDLKVIADQEIFKEGIPQDVARANRDKMQQQIANMIKQSELMDQLKNIRGVDEQINKVIGNALESGDDWMTILYAGLLKLFSKI